MSETFADKKTEIVKLGLTSAQTGTVRVRLLDNEFCMFVNGVLEEQERGRGDNGGEVDFSWKFEIAKIGPTTVTLVGVNYGGQTNLKAQISVEGLDQQPEEFLCHRADFPGVLMSRTYVFARY